MGVQKVRHVETGEVREAMLFSAETAAEVKAWADSSLPDQRSFLVAVGRQPVLALWREDDPGAPPVRLLPDWWLVRRPDWDAPGFVGFEAAHGSEMSDSYTWEDAAPDRVYYVLERLYSTGWLPVMVYESATDARAVAAERPGCGWRVQEVVVTKVVE